MLIHFNLWEFKSNFSRNDLINPHLLVNYIYLDTEERKRIAQSEHKILIRQHQNRECFLGPGSNHKTRSIDLDFNHPVSELMFYFNNTEANKWEPNNFFANAGISSIDISNNIVKIFPEWFPPLKSISNFHVKVLSMTF